MAVVVNPGLDQSDEGCAALTSALRSNPSHLRDLNLSWNNVGDSGKKLLSALKDDEHYKLQTLIYRKPVEGSQQWGGVGELRQVENLILRSFAVGELRSEVDLPEESCSSLISK
ncbi:hypothetical protein QTP70_002203 [Hemibagrus guttatus]|uniref:Uncharacterized protein n=1 Tax=Hemibagrus guttatus TaxID=175788 RepID=A0AAE0QC27_9TELE|nr:hypothetical protein QTP70_002203 [Hemibagrus guttatus]KAK3544093.1 hypothetical protein QTP86_001490 [Hemibagrus guttatus]